MTEEEIEKRREEKRRGNSPKTRRSGN